jgi:hypothetical protein
MTVKERDELAAALGRTEAALREAQKLLDEPSGPSLRDLSERFDISEDALVAFLETAREVLGERDLSVEAARRAALLAAATETWEDELGPMLSSAQVRDLLGGVSRQRVDELLRTRRLIAPRDNSGRRRFPVFQFHDGRPLEPLVAAYWTVADAAASEWTAASWCVAGDDALDGSSPAQWARSGRDSERLARVAEQDAARLAQ